MLSTHQTSHLPAELGKDQMGGHLFVGGGFGGVGKELIFTLLAHFYGRKEEVGVSYFRILFLML